MASMRASNIGTSSPGAISISMRRLSSARAAGRCSSWLIAWAMAPALRKSASLSRTEKFCRAVMSSERPRSTMPPPGTRAVVGWFICRVLPLRVTE